MKTEPFAADHAIERVRTLALSPPNARAAFRLVIVLKRMEGLRKKQIAVALGTSRPTVNLWLKRYDEAGIDGLLHDAPRTGRRPKLSAEKEMAIIDATLHSLPSSAGQWSVRLMAASHGVSRMAVQRLWKKYNLQPRRGTFTKKG
ncbi:MAG: helix-turn-helix domain-containing protein [Deltaproteobacteria bacterium]|nr:helix-turn-helix domain-containing protein [Deltaproteobacteria bacterium]